MTTLREDRAASLSEQEFDLLEGTYSEVYPPIGRDREGIRRLFRQFSFPGVIGDGEAETGALAASWHSNKFLDPARDGAVLPILHLNGYKIANPTILAHIPEQELRSLWLWLCAALRGRLRLRSDARADGQRT